VLVLLLLAAAVLITGSAVAQFLWARLDGGIADTPPLEQLVMGAVIGKALWIAANWFLALTGLFVPAAIWTAAGLFVMAACVIVIRKRTNIAPALSAQYDWRPLLPLIPVALWTTFILWRGTVLPPANHDVLSYHLPKAVLMMRAGGFMIFDAPDHRITSYPFNYELILADVLMLTGSERLTEWVGTATYLLLLLTAGAVAQRWWRPASLAVTTTILATASAPVLILHSGADKNDLMTIWLSLAAILWGSRWVVNGGRTPLFLAILSVVLAVGTKGTAAAVGFALAPVMAVRLVMELKKGTAGVRFLLVLAVTAALLFIACGGVPYAANFVAARAEGRTDLASGSTDAMDIDYGDWSNLWQVPYLLLTIPFSSDSNAVWIPWRREQWFWPHYEIFFSHWGKLLSGLALFLPLAVMLWRRQGAVSERRIASAVAVIAAAIMLPTQLRPLGFFGAFARYIGFLVPVIACWTVPPLIEFVRSRSRVVAGAVAAAVAGIFTLEASICAVHDRFAPLEYALFAAEHPGTRFVWFSPWRAGSIVDRMAGPHDTIAVDGSFDTWVYPAFGVGLTREVIFLPQGTRPGQIAQDVEWVIIDRSWNALWTHPDFTDLGKMHLIGLGTPTPEDIQLFDALSRDPRFEMVYRVPTSNQAVFRRLR
jgi:hypothetical protein